LPVGGGGGGGALTVGATGVAVAVTVGVCVLIPAGVGENLHAPPGHGVAVAGTAVGTTVGVYVGVFVGSPWQLCVLTGIWSDDVLNGFVVGLPLPSSVYVPLSALFLAALYAVIVTVRQPAFAPAATSVMLPRSPVKVDEPLSNVQPTFATSPAPELSAQNGLPGMVFAVLPTVLFGLNATSVGSKGKEML
jgi:hypothetical protein